jgi:hypothetical protein
MVGVIQHQDLRQIDISIIIYNGCFFQLYIARFHGRSIDKTIQIAFVFRSVHLSIPNSMTLALSFHAPERLGYYDHLLY